MSSISNLKTVSYTHLDVYKRQDGDISRLRDFSAEASRRSSEKAIELTRDIKSKLVTKAIDRMLLRYFTESSQECGMEYDESIIK